MPRVRRPCGERCPMNTPCQHRGEGGGLSLSGGGSAKRDSLSQCLLHRVSRAKAERDLEAYYRALGSDQVYAGKGSKADRLRLILEWDWKGLRLRFPGKPRGPGLRLVKP